MCLGPPSTRVFINPILFSSRYWFVFIRQLLCNQMSIPFKVWQSVWQPSHKRCTAAAVMHTCLQKQGTTNSSLGTVIRPTLWNFHPFTWVKQYPVEKVWLPKLHYRGPPNWQGNSVQSHWSSRPTDKGELIKNKNLIKLVLNQQQLQRHSCSL